MSKGQTSRLTTQHVSSGGAVGIFGEDAQEHDKFVGRASVNVFKALQEAHPN
jgi:type II restriction enzyme